MCSLTGALTALFVGPFVIATRLGVFNWTEPEAFSHAAMKGFGAVGGLGLGHWIANRSAADGNPDGGQVLEGAETVLVISIRYLGAWRSRDVVTSAEYG